jgi:hypothetical protein
MSNVVESQISRQCGPHTVRAAVSHAALSGALPHDVLVYFAATPFQGQRGAGPTRPTHVLCCACAMLC